MNYPTMKNLHHITLEPSNQHSPQNHSHNLSTHHNLSSLTSPTLSKSQRNRTSITALPYPNPYHTSPHTYSPVKNRQSITATTQSQFSTRPLPTPEPTNQGNETKLQTKLQPKHRLRSHLSLNTPISTHTTLTHLFTHRSIDSAQLPHLPHLPPKTHSHSAFSQRRRAPIPIPPA